MRWAWPVSVCAVLACWAGPAAVHAALTTVELSGSDPRAYAWVGYAVAMAGSLVAVSSPENTDEADAQGLVDVYDCPAVGAACTLQTTLRGDADAPLFGWGLAATAGLPSVPGEVIVAVGSLEAYTPAYPPNSLGAVYMFTCTGVPWRCVRQARLEPPAENVIEFGRAVAFLPTGLAVGAPYSLQQGVVAVYDDCGPPTWACRLRTQLGSSSFDRDYFGWSVATDGDRVVVGSIGENVFVGAAYLFACPTGSPACFLLAKLRAVGGRSEDSLGWSVALAGPLVVAAAPRALQPGTFNNFGSAHVFACAPVDDVLGPWNCTEQAKLVAATEYPSYFADAVRVAGDRVVLTVEEGGHNQGGADGRVAAGVYHYDCDRTQQPWACVRTGQLFRTVPVTVKYVGHYAMAVAASPTAVALGCFEISYGLAQFVGSAYVFKCDDGMPRTERVCVCLYLRLCVRMCAREVVF
jgi:hypothetical protein